MQNLNLLDVSLRDGGHRTHFHFSDESLEALLVPLDNAGIEYIEIGYRNGSLHPIANLGRAGWCAQDYLSLCRSLIKKAKMVVMVHPKNVFDVDFKNLKDNGVDLMRICAPRGGVSSVCRVIDQGKQFDLRVSVNFIHASQYLEHEMDDVVDRVMKHHPDMIYFADSNGHLMPDKVRDIYAKYTRRYPMVFGFHAHDNLGLAQANTIAALQGGAQYIDASLAGMGKGIGNLKTEFFTAFLHAQHVRKYNLKDILNAANYARRVLHIGHEPIEMDEFTRGIFDYSTAEIRALLREPG